MLGRYENGCFLAIVLAERDGNAAGEDLKFGGATRRSARRPWQKTRTGSGR